MQLNELLTLFFSIDQRLEVPQVIENLRVTEPRIDLLQSFLAVDLLEPFQVLDLLLELPVFDHKVTKIGDVDATVF